MVDYHGVIAGVVILVIGILLYALRTYFPPVAKKVGEVAGIILAVIGIIVIVLAVLVPLLPAS